MSEALRARLAVVFTDEPSERVMDGDAHWRGGPNPPDMAEPPTGRERFGSLMSDVRAVVVHFTEGWPPREKAEEFVRRFIPNPHPAPGTAAHGKWGVGTQYFIAGDMTVAQLIAVPRKTNHAEFVNNWTLGVETGNLGTVAPPSTPGERWRPLSGTADVNADDVPGAKLWISRPAFRDVLVSWWTTATYNGPAGAPLGNRMRMMISEGQYRAWALLARYVAERFEIPRNFPLLPYVLRQQMSAGDEDPADDRAIKFRQIALADERFPMLLRALAPYNVVEDDFRADHESTLRARMDAPLAVESGVGNDFKRHSRIWRDMFNVYRGFHGHGYCGAIILGDHDCPGPLFDWHRFAREVWDWWWYPFDFARGSTEAVTERRPYRRPDADTPLVEYYFEGQELAYGLTESNALRRSHGIFDDISSPSVFALGEGVPVYAPANGELVAARFPAVMDAVSLGFVLVRHEIFHAPDTLTVEMDGGVSFRVNPGRIDYNREPTYVYSLVMHIGRPEGMSFDEVTDANPEWLNRVLIRKKECDLGVEFYDSHTDPGHGGYGARWDGPGARPPGSGHRLTLLEGWRTDKAILQTFVDSLKDGGVALASLGDFSTPIRMLLGDFLGFTGPIRTAGGVPPVTYGISMEVFGNFVPPGFTSVTSLSGWPAGTAPRTAVWYQSEWAKTPSTQEWDRLVSLGVNPNLVTWWPIAAGWTAVHPTLPPAARLNINGFAFHLRPLEFMAWLNGVTWASEWPKYRMTDANGAPVPLAPLQVPRSRRV